MPWTPWERRWREVILAAALPGAPAPGADVWRLWEDRAGFALQGGLRFSVWYLTWLPCLRLRPAFFRLSEGERERVLLAVAASPAWLNRQVILVIRHHTCLLAEVPGGA